MPVITHRNFGNFPETSDPAKAAAMASDRAFARESESRYFRRRARVLVRRAYGPLIVYAVLAIALIAVLAIRVAVWVPQIWR